MPKHYDTTMPHSNRNIPIHAFHFQKQDDKYVLLHDVNTGQGTRVNVVRTSSHPEFGGVEEFGRNDIALVFFDGKVAGPYVKLGGPYPQPNSKIMAAGFGGTSPC